MVKRKKPLVVVVDDEPDTETIRFLGDSVESEFLHPSDLEPEHINRADLILIDQGLTNWPERDDCQLACQPRDGLALAAILRSHVRETKKMPPTAIALLSARLQDLTAGDLPTRHHLIARTFGLEWAFSKDQDNGSQIVSLARAVGSLEHLAPRENEDESDQLLRVLGLKDSAWSAVAVEDIATSQPPIHSVSHWTRGMSILRWLLHRILPYPTFLWNPHQLAIRLGVTTDWLGKELASADSGLADSLKQSRYGGPLQEFLGPRWWGAGVNHQIWTATDGNMSAARNTYGWLSSIAESPAPAPELAVATLSSSLELNDDLSSANECVRVRPDDWPPFAVEAWAQIEDVRDNRKLLSLTDPDDRAYFDESR